MKIAVIGTGYVGLTTGTCFAELGNEVVCVDVDEKKIQDLQKGKIPIYEPGLEELVIKNQSSGRLRFSINTKEAIEFAEIVFSAVGTPPDKDSKADLTNVKAVAREFGKYLNNFKVFVNKSTVPIGTGDLCKQIIRKELSARKIALDFEAISNPEFLKEGSAIEDTLKPERIIIGLETPDSKAKKILEALYKPFLDKKTPILFTDLKTAEIIKYASNAMLATRISFINEIANFCERAGGNIREVAQGMGLDKRIGLSFLQAGAGYGGSCFPKDVKALIETGKEFGYDFEILKATEAVNEQQKESLYHKLRLYLGPLEGKTISILGLAFKPNTDDMREAPSLNLIKKLQADGANIQAYDPAATESAQKIIESFNIIYGTDPYSTAQNSHALVIVTEWPEFKELDLAKVFSLMQGNLLIDGRNIFEREIVEKIGFKYLPVGEKLPKIPEHQKSDLLYS